MKKIFLLSLLCTISHFGFSQELKHGNSFSLNRFISHQKILSIEGEKEIILSIKSIPGSYDKQEEMLLLFDQNHNLIKNMKLELKTGKMKLRAVDIAYLNNRIHVLAIPEELKGETTDFYAIPIDSQSLRPAGIAKKTASVPVRKMGFSNPNRANVHIRKSENGKNTLFFYKGTAKSDDKIISKIIVVDGEFQKVWEKECSFDPVDKGNFLRDLKISNTGDVFLLSEVSRDTKEKSSMKSYYYLNKYSSEGEEKVTIDEKDSQLIDLRIHLDNKNDKVVVTALSTDKPKENSSITGQYFSSFSTKNLEPTAKAFLDLGNDFKEDFKGFSSSWLSHLKDAFITGNGEVVTIAEAVSESKSNRLNSKAGSIPPTHKSLYITKISEEGKILWKQKIEKLQSGFNYRVLSYGALYNHEKENLVIVYNELKKNMDNKVISVQIDNSGKVEQSVLQTIGKSGFFPDLRKSENDSFMYTISAYYETTKLGFAKISSAKANQDYKFGRIDIE